MAKTIISYVATAIVGAVLTLLLWPRETVTVEIPPRESKIDSLAVAKYEMWKKNNVKVFATRDEYLAYIDSLKKANRITIRIPVPGETIRDTVIVVESPSVPEVPGQEFRAPFSHSFTYPEGDTSMFKLSLAYSQFDWPLHPSGSFKDVRVHIPQVIKIVEVPEPPAPFLKRHLGKGLFFVAGLGVGYLATREK